ncbi:MAG: SusD/RagB family nutrient-binding outer membrane lipoprotein [Bacteroidales bacterium]|nr:SusD/RagB family nutrient-binding outer membrane lipoprotein [Bacteroidales bacterium]
MKTNKFINILMSGLLGLVLLGGCTDDFTDINTNKRVLSDIDLATIGNVYAKVQYDGLMSGWNFQISQNLFADLYSQYYSNWQTKFQTDRNVLNRDWLGLAWGGFYGNCAKNLAVVMEKTDPAVAPGLEKQYALSQIWKVFAYNTLRLRIALRISKVDPATAKIQAEKAVAAGVMETNADNAIFHVSKSDNSFNPLPIMLPWNEFRMSASMESVLKGFADPRLPVYFRPAKATDLYTGMRNGCSIPQISEEKRHYDQLSTMGPRWSTPGNEYITPIEIILASEAYFLRAEGALKGWNMGITAEEAYNSGIEMNLLYWGVDPAAITTYQEGTTTPVALDDFTTPPMTNIAVKFGTTPAEQLEQIITQKWLALYPDGWEAWGDRRRLELPKLYPIMVSDNPDVPVGAIMRRVGFVPSEFATNQAAVDDAIQKLGGPDVASTRLWWDPAK